MPHFTIWYCGHCGFGPHQFAIDIHCVVCQRRRDAYAQCSYAKGSVQGGHTSDTASPKEASEKPRPGATEDYQTDYAQDTPSPSSHSVSNPQVEDFFDLEAAALYQDTLDRGPYDYLPSKLPYEISLVSLQSTEYDDDKDGNESEVSESPSDISKTDMKCVIKDFVNVVLESLKERRPSRHTSEPVLQQVSATLLRKLQRYAEKVNEKTPQTVQFRRRRNAIRVILQFRAEIARKLITAMTMSAREIHSSASHHGINDGAEDSDQGGSNYRKIWWRGSVQNYSDATNLLGEEGEGEEKFLPTSVAFRQELQTLALREYKTVRQHLIDCKEFKKLCIEFAQVVQHYCTDMMQLIREHLSYNLPPSNGIVQKRFETKWQLGAFIASYGTQFVDIRRTLTIAGNACNAQLTTVGSYLQRSWPQNPEFLVHKLQSLVLGDSCPRKGDGGLLLVVCFETYAESAPQLKRMTICQDR